EMLETFGPKSEPVENERRSSPRFPCALETYCYPSGKGDTQYPSRILNLSCGGMKLFAERRFEPGDSITVRFRNPDRKIAMRKFHVSVVHIYKIPGEEEK